MLLFRFQATDIAGNERTNEVSANDEAHAIKLLKSRGFSKITLVEIEPPPPPMSNKKKGLLALGALLTLFSLLMVVDNVYLGPPDMKAYFARHDKAVTEGDAEKQYADYADLCLLIGPRGQKKATTRSRLISKVRLTLGQLGEKARIVRESTVKNERWAGSALLVTVEHNTNVGFQDSLTVTPFKTLTIYRWERRKLKWKIVAEKTPVKRRGAR